MVKMPWKAFLAMAAISKWLLFDNHKRYFKIPPFGPGYMSREHSSSIILFLSLAGFSETSGNPKAGGV